MDDVKAPGADNQRLKKLRKLLRDNRQFLLTAAIEAYPEIDVSVCDVILDHLKETQLPEYDGEPNKEPLLAWAAPLVSWRAKRLPRLEELFIYSTEEINEAAYTAVPALTPHYQALGVLAALARTLPLFEGELTEPEFVEWVRSLAAQEALRYQFTETVIAEHGKKIASAIRAALYNRGTVDASVSYQDLYQEVCAYIYATAPILAKTGTTKTAARFKALARKHVGYHMKSLKIDQQVIRNRVASGRTLGVETLSDMELSSIRAGELENTNY